MVGPCPKGCGRVKTLGLAVGLVFSTELTITKPTMEIILIAIAVVWLFATLLMMLGDANGDLVVALVGWVAIGIIPLVAIWGVYKLVIYFL